MFALELKTTVWDVEISHLSKPRQNFQKLQKLSSFFINFNYSYAISWKRVKRSLLFYYDSFVKTRYTVSSLPQTYLWAQERQSSINDVDSPLWWQNKFQLQPCEIGFPWSISGLRIVERFHASALVLFFFKITDTVTGPAACCLSVSTLTLPAVLWNQ